VGCSERFAGLMVLPSLALAPSHVTDSVRLGRKSSMTAWQLLANYAREGFSFRETGVNYTCGYYFGLVESVAC